MDTEKLVCDNVKSIRIQKGYTQEDVAYNANLSVSHLSKVERGITSPTVKTLGKIAVALDVDVNALFKLPN